MVMASKSVSVRNEKSKSTIISIEPVVEYEYDLVFELTTTPKRKKQQFHGCGI